MRDITLKELLEAGCHFGHQANRWQPKATPFIFGERDGVHIIDLAKTREGLLKAVEYLSDVARNGGAVIFVGTKRQAKEIVETTVGKVREVREGGTVGDTKNFYYLLERWPGGLLTNFPVIKKNNLDAIVKIGEDIAAGNFVTKKEKLLAQRKVDKYNKVFGGLVGLEKLPEAIFLVDVKKEDGAVREALAKGVKIIAITDTNVDPGKIDYPIPANDDAVGSIRIIIEYLTEAWMEGLQSIKNVGPDNSSL